jgi:hypothetical protein
MHKAKVILAGARLADKIRVDNTTTKITDPCVLTRLFYNNANFVVLKKDVTNTPGRHRPTNQLRRVMNGKRRIRRTARTHVDRVKSAVPGTSRQQNQQC